MKKKQKRFSNEVSSTSLVDSAEETPSYSVFSTKPEELATMNAISQLNIDEFIGRAKVRKSIIAGFKKGMEMRKESHVKLPLSKWMALLESFLELPTGKFVEKRLEV
jgi:hypothetical protein